MFFLAGRALLPHCGKAPIDKGMAMSTAPTPEDRQRMTSVLTLYEALLDAAGVQRAHQVFDLIFLQALLQAPENTLQALRDLAASHAQLRAELH